jgi:poly(hydroxyalkanoate) depolymerase family esterase
MTRSLHSGRPTPPPTPLPAPPASNRSRTWRALGAALFTAAAAAAALTGLTVTAPAAHAASLVQVTNFGYNPSNLQMWEYVPASASAHPPILLALHQCTGSGPGFYSGTQFASLADQYGFIVVYPSVTRSGSCWDVSSPGALTSDGDSDPAGLISMITYVEQHNDGDSTRVYVTGASSGAMMTNVMLGDYPGVFKAGAAYMGVPFGCFAGTEVDEWNSACAEGQTSMTPQAWGNLVRNADPGYTGVRPRMQLWHGTADTTLNYNDFGEEIKQWTNVLGVSQTPTTTDTPVSGWTRTRYDDASGTVQVEAYSIAGAGHVLPEAGMEAYAIHFFGLDTSAPPSSGSPTTAPPSSAPPSSSSPTGGGGGCKVVDSVSAWNTGMTENLTITNNGAAVNGWKLTFTLGSGQVITNGWNATYSPSSGAVTATSMSYNASIPSGGSTSIGFQANQSGNAAAPTSFALNGVACTTG